MNSPPISIDDLNLAIERGLIAMGGEHAHEVLRELTQQALPHFSEHIALEHTWPSPSGINACRLQQWYGATGAAPDIVYPAQWRRQATLGIFMELWWVAVLRLGGLNVQVFDAPVVIDETMKGIPDASLLGCPIEFKAMTGWEYKRVLEGYGVQQTKAEHYSQLQLYMHGMNAKWGLYAATPMDPRLLEQIMRQRRKYGTGFVLRWTYLEWIAYDEEYVNALLQRAKILADDTKSSNPPPREDTGVTVTVIGKQRWPCGYCAFPKSCVDLYGISDYG